LKILNFKIIASIFLAFSLITSTYANDKFSDPTLRSINAKAYGLYVKGNYNSAFAVYKRGLSLYPQSASLYDGVGAVYLKKKQFNQAYENFNKASQLDTSNSLYKIHAQDAIYKSNMNKVNTAKYLLSTAFIFSPVKP
jgi:tetratricopeptide (TPR) repeat protein